MDDGNITIRRKKPVLNDSLNDSFQSTLSADDYLTKTLPDLSTRIEPTEILHDEIQDLKQKLEQARNKIEVLLRENSTLKSQTVEQQNTIAQLQIIHPTSTPKKAKQPSATSQREGKVSHHNKSFENVNERPKLNVSSNGPHLEVNAKMDLLRQKPLDGVSEIRSMPVNDSATQDSSHKKHLDGATVSRNIKSISQCEPKEGSTGPSFLDQKPKVQILGGQQCSDLASALIHSRNNTNYQKLRITSTIKPHATTEEILSSHYELCDNQNNFLILCVGESDKNPNNIIIQLASILKCIKKTNVIVLSIFNNSYLNETLLNHLLKNISQNFKNCTFLELGRHYYSKKRYLFNTCKEINCIIDTNYYNHTFLSYKEPVRVSTVTNTFKEPIVTNTYKEPVVINSVTKNTQKAIPVKGTIPYYFSKINMNNSPNKTFFRDHTM